MPSGPGRRSIDRPSPWALAALLATVLVLLVLAATSGVVRVWSEPPPRTGGTTTQVVTTTPDDGPGVSQGKLPAATSVDGDGWWMRVVAVILAVVIARVLVITVKFWWNAFRNRERREQMPTGTPFDVLARPPLPVEVHHDLDAQTAALAEGEARNAIVHCWLVLEEDVAAAGMPRHASETTVEYTGRVLGAALVDRSAASAVDELAELYREARFSRHEVDDARRARALAALRTIHGALRPADVGAAAP